MPTDAELLAKLIEDPTNPDAYLVYADFLQSKGDPRGELVMLQHRGKDAEAKALLEEHEEALLGPLARYATTFDGTDEPAFEWRLGFIRKARFSYDSNAADDVDVADGPEISLEAGLEALLGHPSGALLEELVVPINMLDDGAYFEPIVKAIAEHGAPALRRLRIGEFTHAGPGGADNGYEYEISWTTLGDATGLWRAVPRLERLVLQVGLGSTSASGTTDVLGDIDLPKLQHLEVITGGMSESCLRSFANAKLPSLAYMDLWLGDPNYGAGGTAEDLQPIFDGTNLPKLTHLGLMNAPIADEICAHLASAKIAVRLEEISLAYGTMTDEGATALAEGKRVFAKLKKLAVDANCLGEAGLAAVRGLAPVVTTDEQKEEDEDSRFVSLGE